MIGPETQRIQRNGEAEEFEPEIYAVLRISAASGGFIFATGIFSGCAQG
jgi:hypothetical protein